MSSGKTPAVGLGIVVQARMASTRLPGKILELIAGRPLLDHVVGRAASLDHACRLVVATSDGHQDDVVERYCAERGLDCFRGSEQDVLARYYECARSRGFTDIVRLTGDNPFVDVEELDRLIDLHVGGGYDYSSSLDDLPEGAGAELFTFGALERVFQEARAPYQREHVNEYVLENPGFFRIGRLPVTDDKRHPEVRLTVDTPDDLERARFLAARADGAWLTTRKAIDLCLHCA